MKVKTTNRTETYSSFLNELYSRKRFSNFSGLAKTLAPGISYSNISLALMNLGFMQKTDFKDYLWIGGRPDMELAIRIKEEVKRIGNPSMYGQPTIDHNFGLTYGKTPIRPSTPPTPSVNMDAIMKAAQEKCIKAVAVAKSYGHNITLDDLTTQQINDLSEIPVIVEGILKK